MTEDGIHFTTPLIERVPGQERAKHVLFPAVPGVVAFTGVFLVVALAFWKPLWTLLRLAIGNDEYTHVLIILPLSFVLIVLDRERIFRDTAGARYPAIGWGLAGAVLVGAAGLFSAYALSLLIAGLVSFWLAAFVFFFGSRSFRTALFPLLLGVLLVPIPKPALDVLIGFLQRGSASVAFLFLKLAGISVGRDGLILFLPGLNIEVATECSGIRSSLVLFVTSIVIAHLFLSQGWKQVLVALLVIPVTILKNGFRIFVLSWWAVTVDAGILSSWIHRDGGVIFFLLGLALIILAIWLLQKLDTWRDATVARLPVQPTVR
jgi:exosortase